MLPPDHPQRLMLADEVHARPPEPLETPSRATYVALLVDPDDRAREAAHVAALCERHGVAPPPPGSRQFSAQLGALRLKWERHGEFSGLTVFAKGLSPRPFSEPVAAMLPAGWLAEWPGRTLVAAHAKLVAAPDASAAPFDADTLALHFGANQVIGAEIGDGAGLAYTDFRIHADGFARFLVCNRSLTQRQAGRTLQRLFEIEAYRVLALLALPVAQSQASQALAVERALTGLTAQIAIGATEARATPDAAAFADDESLLHELTRLAAEVESSRAASQFRYGACRAYHALVLTRIAELRETRLTGVQTIAEFMARRLTPAVDTCMTVAQRLHDLSERVAQASALLSTRVDITRERQNQALLASMDRRAKLQLRLQQTVEGLSVAAIVYYVAGLVGYVAKAAKAGGAPLNPDFVVGASIPLLVLGVVLALRRARHGLHQDVPRDASGASTH